MNECRDDPQLIEALLGEIERVLREVPYLLRVGDATEISNYALIRLRDVRNAIDRARGSRVVPDASRSAPEEVQHP